MTHARTIATIFAFFACLTVANAQTDKKISIFIHQEYSKTLSDRTKENNISGLGFGIKALWGRQSRFSPYIQMADDFVFLDDKVWRGNSDGSLQLPVENAFKVFAGVNWNISQAFHLSTGAGPSFINSQTLPSFKAGLGLYFGKSQRWILSTDYISILNRDSGEKQNYNSVVFSIGLRLF